VKKALLAGSLQMLGSSGNQPFARNLSESGLVGLQTLEGQRELQRKQAAAAAAAKRDERRVAAEEGRVGIQKEQLEHRKITDEREYQRAVKADQATAEFRKKQLEVQGRQADQGSFQDRILDTIATDMVVNGEVEPVRKSDGSIDHMATKRRGVRMAHERLSEQTEAEFVATQLDKMRKTLLPGETMDEEVEAEKLRKLYQDSISRRTNVPRGTQAVRERQVREAGARQTAELATKAPLNEQELAQHGLVSSVIPTADGTPYEVIAVQEGMVILRERGGTDIKRARLDALKDLQARGGMEQVETTTPVTPGPTPADRIRGQTGGVQRTLSKVADIADIIRRGMVPTPPGE
jgi:hypothetical protein